jgi:hypothetical protein
MATAQETGELYERMRLRGGWLVAWKITLRNRASFSAPNVCAARSAPRGASPREARAAPGDLQATVEPRKRPDPYYEIFYNRGSIAEAQPSGEIVPWSWRIAEEPELGRIGPFAVGVGIHVYLGPVELERLSRVLRRIRVRAHHEDLIGAGKGWAAFSRVQVID